MLKHRTARTIGNHADVALTLRQIWWKRCAKPTCGLAPKQPFPCIQPPKQNPSSRTALLKRAVRIVKTLVESSAANYKLPLVWLSTRKVAMASRKAIYRTPRHKDP